MTGPKRVAEKQLAPRRCNALTRLLRGTPDGLGACAVAIKSSADDTAHCCFCETNPFWMGWPDSIQVSAYAQWR